jgi:regulator of sigma E protease
MTTILAAALVLGVLIFVHELGHFVTAKMVDIEVPRFSIGFGPRILGFRRGETEYVLSLLPLGGYVKMAGMEEMEGIEGGPSEEERVEREGEGARRKPGPRDFESKSLAARTLVISAGVIMNLLFAVFAFSSIGLIWGVPQTPEPVIGNILEELLTPGTQALADVPRMARLNAIGSDTITNFEDLRLVLSTARAAPTEIRFANAPSVTIEIPPQDSARATLITVFEPVLESEPVLTAVTEGGPAEMAGLEVDDRIIAADGERVQSWQELGAAIEANAGQILPLTVERGDRTMDILVQPELSDLDNGVRVGRIGVGGRSATLAVPRERLGPMPALVYGFTETGRWVALTVDFLAGMFTGRISARSVGGPIAITQISGEAARAGVEVLINFMALLSVNLAVLNLLPIPVLDGGHLVFLLVEAVRGRPVSVEQRVRWTKVGFIMILALMTFAIGNDIVRWIGF